MEAPPLPRQADALEGHVYAFSENPYGTLMPLILRALTHNDPPPLSGVGLSFSPGMCQLTFRDAAGGETVLNAGLDADACRSDLVLNGEHYPVSAWAHLTSDEDDRPVLKLSLCFLQTPCVRQMKFIFYRGESRVLVRFTEFPDVGKATEMLFHLVSGGGGTLQKMFSDAVRQQKLRGRLDAITRPIARGAEKEDESMPELF